MSVQRRRAVMRVSAGLLAQPVPVQQFAAAHEMAHVVLRHRVWGRLWPALLWMVAVATVEVAGMWSSMHRPDGTAELSVLLLGGLGPLVSGLGAWALLAWRTRRCERAADQLAAAWGYTATSSLDACRQGENRFTTSRLYRPFRMHPLPEQRTGRSASAGPRQQRVHGQQSPSGQIDHRSTRPGAGENR